MASREQAESERLLLNYNKPDGRREDLKSHASPVSRLLTVKLNEL
jgi:hypothetical protein